MKRPTKQEISWGRQNDISIPPEVMMTVHVRERYLKEKNNG